jgi:hypothetical protein
MLRRILAALPALFVCSSALAQVPYNNSQYGLIAGGGGGGGSLTVQKGGSAVGTRATINIIDGTNVTTTVADDAGNNRVNVTIAATGGGGVADGDKGDITVSGAGATWSIDAAAVTLADMANLAQDQVIGRVTASTGVPETFTVTSAARTVLDDTSVAAMRTTLGAAGGTGTANGTNTGDQTITLTSDVTGSGTGSFATTIANNAVTNAKSADMAVNTVKCRITTGTGDPEDCTAANIRTIISAVSGSATEFLNGQGNFATPAGGGGGVLDTWHFQAESFDDADANTPNTVNASLATSTLGATSALLVRSFSGAALNSAGGKLRIPTGATTCTFDWTYGAAAAPGVTNNKVRWKVGVRALGSTGALTDYTFTDQTNADNTTQAFFTQTVSTATLGWSTSTPYYFQLSRVITGVTNNMTQAAELSEWDVRCQ